MDPKVQKRNKLELWQKVIPEKKGTDYTREGRTNEVQMRMYGSTAITDYIKSQRLGWFLNVQLMRC